MKNIYKTANKISALGYDVYICRIPQNAIFFVDCQTRRIYVCFYEAPVDSKHRGLLGIGVIHLNTKTGQPYYMGAEYGCFVRKDGVLMTPNFNSFFKAMISDIEKSYRDDPLFPLFTADELSEKYIAQIAFKLGFELKHKI